MTLGLLGIVFVTDLLVPLGIAHGALYVLPVMLAAWSRSKGFLITVAVLSATLTLLAFGLQYPPAPDAAVAHVATNRLVSLAAIGVVASLALALTSRYADLEAARGEIDRHRQMLDMAGRTARFGAWSIDLASEQVEWTEEVARIHGLDPDFSPSLESAIEYYMPEHREQVRNAVARCIEEGEAWDEEWELLTASGGRVWVRSIGEPVTDDGGRIVGAQGAFQDIDARKRAEESAQVNRTRLRQLANAMPLIVWTAESDGNLDFVNQYTIEYAGLESPDEATGERWLALIHPDDRDRAVKTWMESIDKEIPHSVEFRVRRHDGQYRWFQTTGTPVRNRDGEIEVWFGASIDIHEQRTLARRLVRTLESITDVFCAFDHEWRFIYVNAQGEKLVGRNREELIGEVVWDVFPEARDTIFEREYRRAMETGRPVHFVAQFEPLEAWLENSAYPSDDGLAVYARDITHQRRTEEQLRQAQRLESIGQLTGGLAHDFNNLLTVVIGNAELLAERSAEQPELHQLARIIGNAAERGSELTRRLLAFARKQTLEPRPIDVNRLVADMEPLLRRALGEYIELEFTRSAGLWPAMIDPGQLEDALLNLAINARDAMPEGGELTIETYNAHIDDEYAADIQDLPRGQYVAIAVSDTGTGIPEADQERVFEPFFTTKKKEKGTGLGLAMVYGFVRQSGGHVRLYSEEDQGTTVRLYLPRTHQMANQTVEPERTPGGGAERVLLVEDDEMVRPYARQQLESLGYHVTEASSGPEALELLEQENDFDLLFTDVIMPGMSGKQLVDQARAKNPSLKVLYTSGYTENAIVHQGRLDPGVHLLAKPYRRIELANAVRRALESD